MALEAVPTIDLNAPDVVSRVRSACENVGFFLLRNHGVDQHIIDAAWDRVRAFFDEPVDLKRETPMTDEYPYGYSGLETEKAGNEGGAGAYGTSDLKESWQVCLSSMTPAEGVPEPQWPRAPDGFRQALIAYYRAMEGLSGRLLTVFAAALNLPPTFFDDKCDRHWCALRALNYPEQTVAPRPGQLRIAPHSDYGVLTLLKADAAPGGLEVLRSDGSWSPVSIPPECFCVNLGDLMQRWTNDKWRSTVHRVANPPPDIDVPTRRQSMAFFHNLNRNAIVEAIPSCVAPGDVPLYPPINAFDHLMERHARAMGAAKAFGKL